MRTCTKLREGTQKTCTDNQNRVIRRKASQFEVNMDTIQSMYRWSGGWVHNAAAACEPYQVLISLGTVCLDWMRLFPDLEGFRVEWKLVRLSLGSESNGSEARL